MAPHTLRTRLEPYVGGPARTARRRWQWWRMGAAVCLTRGPQDAFPVVAFEHATPLFRTLSGLDHELQVNKLTNLTLATDRLRGLVLEPGQRLSFWHEVGRPSAARGYLPGLVLDHGHMRTGVGGGLCQLTNLLYWMTLHTELTVVERWRHSYDVFADSGRTQPFASGATCSYPALDLQVENRTGAAYRLEVGLDSTHLRGAWSTTLQPRRTFEVYEREHAITPYLPGLYQRSNELWRRSFDRTGELVDDELVVINHAFMMYSPELSAGPAGQTSTVAN